MNPTNYELKRITNVKNVKRKDLLYPELGYQIIGILFEVHNELGYGHQEKYYQKAISSRFKELNLNFKERVPVQINFQKNKIGEYFLDFVIKDKIALEIKQGERFLKSNVEQLYAYLKVTGLKLGILANFTRKSLQFKRIINLYS